MRQQTSSILLQPLCHVILHRHQLLMSSPADIATRGWRCTLAESKPAVVSVHPDDHLPKPKWICLWQRVFSSSYQANRLSICSTSYCSCYWLLWALGRLSCCVCHTYTTSDLCFRVDIVAELTKRLLWDSLQNSCGSRSIHHHHVQPQRAFSKLNSVLDFIFQCAVFYSEASTWCYAFNTRLLICWKSLRTFWEKQCWS